jgi:hypothetical protein
MTFHTNTPDNPDTPVAPLPKVISILTREVIPGAPDHAVTVELGRVVFEVEAGVSDEAEQLEAYHKTTRELATAFTKLGEQWTKIANHNDELLASLEDDNG